LTENALNYLGIYGGAGSEFVGTGTMTRATSALAKDLSLVDTADDAARAARASGLLGADDIKGLREVNRKIFAKAIGERSYSTAARSAGRTLATYAKPIGTAFNAAMYATLFYDIGKGVGSLAMAQVNFAKDAFKSLQGTINKPIFGAGYRDNEVAATSRSRGVMAIQNSRLNARSLLGSEASMLAAHFG